MMATPSLKKFHKLLLHKNDLVHKPVCAKFITLLKTKNIYYRDTNAIINFGKYNKMVT